MSEQAPNNSGNAGSNSNGEGGQPRRNNNRNRNRNRNRPRPEGAQAQSQSGQPNHGQQRQNPGSPRPPREGGAHQQGHQQAHGPRQPNQQQNRRPQNNNNNRNRPRPENRPQGAGQQHNNGGGFSFERIYEKYLNLLDQHIIARRKYHDLFYRADYNQKNKLEKNFYNTLNDIRDFENKLAPDVRAMFEKRNNGLQYDRTYTSNHEISIDGDPVPNDLPPAEPHYLQSQIAADYSGDCEESIGTAEDYLKYKNIF
jgi:hypothetical protein